MHGSRAFQIGSPKSAKTREKGHKIFCFRTVDLIISGLKDDVYQALEFASTLIQEYKEALTCAEYVIWKYQDINTNGFNDFPLRVSFQLESAYKVCVCAPAQRELYECHSDHEADALITKPPCRF